MNEQRPSKERIGLLIDYWTAKSKSHERWPEGQGLQAELVGLIYADTITALKQMHSAHEPPAVTDAAIDALLDSMSLDKCYREGDTGDRAAVRAWLATLRTAQPPGDVG